MDPIVTVLRVGGGERIVGSYGVMLAVAIVVGSSIAVRAAARARMDTGAVVALLGFLAGGAALGAWSLFVAVEWMRTGTPLMAIENPGLVFFGAPVGGAVAVALTAKRLGVPVGRFVDVALPAMPAAHAMGRIGCFLGGCCFGKPWDGVWAVTYTHPMAPAAYPPVPRHPTPLYESAGLLLLALSFALVPLERVGRGRRLAAYLACYGVLRVAVEAFRGDAIRGLWLGGLVSTSQLLGGALVVASLIAVWALRPLPTGGAAV